MRNGIACAIAAIVSASAFGQVAVPSNGMPAAVYAYPGADYSYGFAPAQYPYPATPVLPGATDPPSPAQAALCGCGCGCQEPAARCFGSAEYLLWFVKSGPVGYPLATTGDSVNLGAVGRPGTVNLFGDDTLHYGVLAGMRATIGYWLDSAGTYGVMASGLFSEQRSDLFAVASSPTGSPIISRPFTTLGGDPAALTISRPNQGAGSITASSSSRFWGGEGDGVCRMYQSCGCRIDGLVGFRYFAVDENLNVGSHTQLLNGTTVPFSFGSVTAPTVVETADHFGTLSQFYGGQVGVNAVAQKGRYYLGGTFKLAMGATYEIVNQTGLSRTIDAAGAVRESPAGLLVLQSNYRHQSVTRFAVLPELGVKVGCDVTQHLGLWVGYDFLYLSSVIRPGDQIDRTVDTTGLPVSSGFTNTPTRPRVQLNSTDYWAQGVSFGLSLKY